MAVKIIGSVPLAELKERTLHARRVKFNKPLTHSLGIAIRKAMKDIKCQ